MGFLRRVGVAAALWIGGACAALAACAPDRVEVRGPFGAVAFRTELALTPREQARGLMFREALPRFASMLFVFPASRERSFWMRNTLIPLDIIFVDETGTVIRVGADAVPLDETPVRSDGPARAVLEINGGLAAQLGIAPGAELRSPALPQETAAWPCN